MKVIELSQEQHSNLQKIDLNQKLKNTLNKIQERKEIIQDVVRQQKKPKRIPIMSQTRAWPIFDSGNKLVAALKDLDLMFDIVDKFQARYQFDCHYDPGLRFPYKVYEAMDSSPYIFDEERESIEYKDIPSMMEDEYPAFIEKGVFKFYFENAFARRFKLTDTGKAIQSIAKATLAQKENAQFQNRIIKHQIEKHGVPSIRSGTAMAQPVEALFGPLRGIKGFSFDLRRNEKYILNALEAIDNGACEKGCKAIENFEETDSDVFATGTTMLAHTILNPKQFGKYYWPILKKYIDATVKANKLGMIFAQGSMEHLIDFFREIPKGHFLLVVELSDIQKLRTALPNLSFAGGYPAHVLGHGNKQECVDRAKKIIDEIGYDGRLIITTNKMLAFRNDAKGENLEAVNNFIREYGVYK
jgi:hypothetical protein